MANIQLGNSSATAGIIGLASINVTPAGTPATDVATVLMSYLLPANAIDANPTGSPFTIKAQGTFGATANAKLLTFELLDDAGVPGSGQTIFTAGPTVWNNAAWELNLTVVANGTTQITYYSFDVVIAGVSDTRALGFIPSTVDFTTSVMFALIGENDVAAAALDTTARMMYIQYQGTPM